MNRHRLPRPTPPAIALALFVLLAGTSCASLLPQAEATPVVQTQVVTLEVTRQVTLEVTRVVDVPVTVTPTETLQFTHTPSLTPTITGTPELPRAVILEYSDCLYGPAEYHLYKTSWLAGSEVEVVGRSQDELWINVQEVHGWNACWLPAAAADLNGIDLGGLPVVTTVLPASRYEYGPPAGYARRNGDEVTVYWGAVWISRDEVRGYLLEAKTCQGGAFIEQYIFVGTTFDENVGTFSYVIQDEAGCEQTSGVRIASVGKRGYTLFEKVFWPPPP